MPGVSRLYPDKGHADGTMETTHTIADDEDLMAAALTELRQERTDVQDAPATEPVPDVVEPVATADTVAAPAVNPKDQPAADDPAETLRKTKEALHKAQSELGRVGALNRHLNETRARLDQVMRENASLKQAGQGSQAPANSGQAAAKLAELSARVKDFPELTDLVSAVAESLQEANAKAAAVATQAAAQVVQPLEGLRAEAEQRHRMEREAAYEAALSTFHSTYPTAVEAIKGPEFQAWIASAPKQVQDAFSNGGTPEEALAVMDAYDAHLRRSGRPSIATYRTTQQPATQAAPKATNNAARLQSAAGLPSRASGAKGGLPPEDDFEGSLEHFRRQRLRAQAA